MFSKWNAGRFLALLLSSMPAWCFASGFAQYELSAAASAMSHAYICRVEDPSAVWYNPAALIRLEGDQMYFGTAFIQTDGDFTPRESSNAIDAVRITSVPVNLYFSHQISDDTVLAFGVYNPFGLTTEWPEDSQASFVNIRTKLRAFYLTPSIGYKITPNLSIGGGVDFVIADLTLQRNVSPAPASPFVIVQDVKVDGSDFGFNLGALVKTNSNVQFAFTYKHKVDVDFDGSVAFENVPAAFRPVFEDGGANITLPLPSQMTVGAATSFSRVSFEGNVIWTRWDDLEALRLNFDRNTPPDTNLRRAYRNSWSVRLGTQFNATKHLSLRGGYLYDRTPVPDKAVDPILPDASRNRISVGAGYGSGSWRFDAAYSTLLFEDRESPVDNFTSPLAAGLYTNTTNQFAFGLAYKF